MGQALYRKYRSKSLSEVVGQEHVTKTLASALEKGSISHAYLFTGPRGVGKTSIARILAHAVNNLPYDDKSTHLDIIEIDAASNRRIDEIRELRERISNAPTSAKYKVYIIDEVHMLTKEAFNALLKTLEEPPAHVIFILATTEAHKLPATIVSRTQRFTFKPIDTAQAAKHLAKIAKKEGVDATSDALELIAKHGEGSFRDSISLLDQASALGKRVDAELVREILGVVPASALDLLIAHILSGSSADVIQLLRQLKEQGIQPEVVAKQLAEKIRSELLAGKRLFGQKDTTNLLSRLVEIPVSHDPAALLEITLLDLTLSNTSTQSSEAITPVSEETISAQPAEIAVKSVKSKPRKAQAVDATSWQEILNAIRAKHSTLYGLARMAEPHFSETTITLEFTFPFHQKRLNDDRNKKVILALVKEITGKEMEIICTLTEKKASPKKTKEKVVNTPSTLDNISNIFGSAEVLE